MEMKCFFCKEIIDELDSEFENDGSVELKCPECGIVVGGIDYGKLDLEKI